jgi:hypothetical protein
MRPETRNDTSRAQPSAHGAQDMIQAIVGMRKSGRHPRPGRVPRPVPFEQRMRYGAIMAAVSDVIAVLRPSPVRRALALLFILGLGGICLALAALRPPADPVWMLVLVVVGGGALWLALRLARATRTCIELTEAGLRDGEGRVLAPIARIVAVERGVFAFKPSNGFLVRLDAPSETAWQPGLWWRFGRRIGIGGVTPGAQGRIMADALTALLVSRDGT